MKTNRLKRCLALVLSLLMLGSTMVSAIDTATVTFDESKQIVMTGLFDNFLGVMPGDTRTESITINNDCADYDYIKVYLRAEANSTDNIQSVEDAADEDVALMNDFLAQLNMTVDVDGEAIFDDALDGASTLSENVLLGTLNKNESMSFDVTLEVPIEMGNEYAIRSGEVDWIFTIEAFDYPTPSSNTTTHTVRKVWVDNESTRPDSIDVQLLRNGEYYDEVTLSEDNQWVYSWSNLSKSSDWDVVEVDVPATYTASYSESGTTTTITNTGSTTTILDVPDIDIPLVDIPDMGLPEIEIPDLDVPLSTMTSLSVKKLWDDDGEDTPTEVLVTLYEGETAVESVWLGDWNDWSYTWGTLTGTGEYQVVETDIPTGYVPSYTYEDGVVTIVNTATLIQTGQLNWPIFAMGGLGILFIAGGLILVLKKRNPENV